MGRPLLGHLLLTVVLAAGATAAATASSWHSAQLQAQRTATQVSAAIADASLAKLARNDFGSPHGFDRTDVLGNLRPFLESGTLYRVKLWIVEEQQARIVVSDEARLEGTTRPVDPRLFPPIGSAAPAGFDVPDDAEHRFETSRRGDLLEVFHQFHDAARNSMSLETYVPITAVATLLQAMRATVPPLLVGILIVGLATTPLTVAAARRAHRRAEHHRALASTASDRARREVAQRLHDGPIQTLAAAGVAMSVEPATSLQRRAGDIVRDGIRQLRTLTEDIATAAVPARDLPERLPAMLRPLVPAPIELDLQLPSSASGARLTDEQALVIARAAPELVRNAVRHGHPSRIEVVLDLGRSIQLTVRDNGVGFGPEPTRRPGHVGLALIEQAAAGLGGTLAVQAAPGQGCVATLRLP